MYDPTAPPIQLPYYKDSYDLGFRVGYGQFGIDVLLLNGKIPIWTTDMQVLYAKRLRELLDIWQPPTPKANEKAITKKEYLQAAMMSMVINRKRRFDTDFVEYFHGLDFAQVIQDGLNNSRSLVDDDHDHSEWFVDLSDDEDLPGDSSEYVPPKQILTDKELLDAEEQKYLIQCSENSWKLKLAEEEKAAKTGKKTWGRPTKADRAAKAASFAQQGHNNKNAFNAMKPKWKPKVILRYNPTLADRIADAARREAHEKLEKRRELRELRELGEKLERLRELRELKEKLERRRERRELRELREKQRRESSPEPFIPPGRFGSKYGSDWGYDAAYIDYLQEHYQKYNKPR